MSITLFFQAVFKHRKILFFWYFCCFLIAIAAYVFMSPVYVSTAKWYIQKESSESIFFDMQSAGSKQTASSVATTFLDLPSINFNKIDAEILKSYDIVKAVISELDLKNSSGQPLSVTEFRKRLYVKPDKRYPFITIKYFAKSPQEAYDVVSTIQSVYLKKNIRAESQKARKNKTFLKTQIALVKKYLNVASRKLLNFEKRTYLVNVDAEANQQQMRIAFLKSNLADYQADYNDIKARVKDLKRKLKTYSTDQAIDKVIVGGDPNINELRNLLVKKNKNLIELKSRYTDKHFAVVEKKDEINGIKKEIMERQKVLIGKYYSPDKIVGIKNVNFDLANDLAKYSSQEVALKAKIDAVNDTLQSYLKEIESLPAKKLKHKNLEFDLKMYKTLFKNLSLAYEMANISEVFSQNTVNITQIIEPEKALKPKYPDLFLNCIIALIAAILGSFLNIVYVSSKYDKVNNIKQLQDIEPLKPIYGLNILLDKELLYSYNNGFLEDQKTKDILEQLRQNLLFLNASNKDNLFSFSGINNNYFNALTLLYVAISLSKVNKKVCILDLSLQDEHLSSLLDYEHKSKGLFDLLIDGSSNIKNYIIDLKLFDTVHYISSGTRVANHSSLLESSTFKVVIDSLKQSYDFILIYTPDINDTSNSLPVFNIADGVLLTGESNSLFMHSIIQAEKTCKSFNISVVGMIFNS